MFFEKKSEIKELECELCSRESIIKKEKQQWRSLLVEGGKRSCYKLHLNILPTLNNEILTAIYPLLANSLTEKQIPGFKYLHEQSLIKTPQNIKKNASKIKNLKNIIAYLKGKNVDFKVEEDLGITDVSEQKKYYGNFSQNDINFEIEKIRQLIFDTKNSSKTIKRAYHNSVTIYLNEPLDIQFISQLVIQLEYKINEVHEKFENHLSESKKNYLSKVDILILPHISMRMDHINNSYYIASSASESEIKFAVEETEKMVSIIKTQITRHSSQHVSLKQ